MNTIYFLYGLFVRSMKS